MAFTISYCATCGARLQPSDFEKGAVEWNGRTYCSKHVPGAARTDSTEAAGTIKPARPSSGPQKTSTRTIAPRPGTSARNRPTSAGGGTNPTKPGTGPNRTTSTVRTRSNTSKPIAAPPSSSGASGLGGGNLMSSERLASAAAAYQAASSPQKGPPVALIVIGGVCLLGAVSIGALGVFGSTDSSTPPAPNTAKPNTPAGENLASVPTNTPGNDGPSNAGGVPGESAAMRQWRNAFATSRQSLAAIRQRPPSDIDAWRKGTMAGFERAKQLLTGELPSDLTEENRGAAQKLIADWRDAYADACAKTVEAQLQHRRQFGKLRDMIVYIAAVLAGGHGGDYPAELCDANVVAFNRLLKWRDDLLAEQKAEWATQAQALPEAERQLFQSLQPVLLAVLAYRSRPRTATDSDWVEGKQLLTELLDFSIRHRDLLFGPDGQPRSGPVWEAWYIACDPMFSELQMILRILTYQMEFRYDVQLRQKLAERVNWWVEKMPFHLTVRFWEGMEHRARYGFVPSESAMPGDAKITAAREAALALANDPSAQFMDIFRALALLDFHRRRTRPSRPVEAACVAAAARITDRLVNMWLARHLASPSDPHVRAMGRLLADRMFERNDSPDTKRFIELVNEIVFEPPIFAEWVALVKPSLEGRRMGEPEYDAMFPYAMMLMQRYAEALEKSRPSTGAPPNQALVELGSVVIGTMAPGMEALMAIEPTTRQEAEQYWHWCRQFVVCMRQFAVVNDWEKIHGIYENRSLQLFEMIDQLPVN